ncbi:RnfABCDGE type electron transport complex subunit D [Haploplasma axanthum]|nr:RnfABCDGE type electron transport complex subunit D [Haploplasma axanthum]
MQAVVKTSPYIRKATSTKRMMVDVLIALIPVIAFAIYRFKFDFVLRALLASVLAVGLEALAFGLMKEKNETWKERFKKYTVNNVVPPIITALIFLLTLPSNISFYVIIIGVVFAILIGKMIYGGLGKNIFNPAGIGRVFVGLTFASFFVYQGLDDIAGATALSTPYADVLKSYSFLDLFLGNVPGSSGEISALAILIGGAYLIIRRSADYRVILAGLLSFALFMCVAGLGLGYGFNETIKYTLFHILSGGLLFGLVFMATDPITSPYTRPGRLIFGLIIGLLVAAIRLFGSYPEGMVFAIVIANAFVPLIDYKKWTTNIYTKKFIIAYSVSIVVLALIVFAGVGGFAL